MSSIVLLISGLVAFFMTHLFNSSDIARRIYHPDPDLGTPGDAYEAWPLAAAVSAPRRALARRRQRVGVAALQEGE